MLLSLLPFYFFFFSFTFLTLFSCLLFFLFLTFFLSYFSFLFLIIPSYFLLFLPLCYFFLPLTYFSSSLLFFFPLSYFYLLSYFPFLFVLFVSSFSFINFSYPSLNFPSFFLLFYSLCYFSCSLFISLISLPLRRQISARTLSFFFYLIFSSLSHSLLSSKTQLGVALTDVENHFIHILAPIAQWLGASNSCINPILYAFFNNRFRAGFKVSVMRKNLFCCHRLCTTHCKSLCVCVCVCV